MLQDRLKLLLQEEAELLREVQTLEGALKEEEAQIEHLKQEIKVHPPTHRLRSSAAVCGCLQQSVGVCSSLRVSAAVCGCLWMSATVCSCLRESVGICHCLRTSEGICSGLWESATVCSRLPLSAAVYGCLLLSRFAH